MMGNNHHYIVLEHSHHPQKKPCISPHSLPQSLGTTSPLLIALCLSLLHISGKRSHTMCVAFCAWLLSLPITFSRFTHIAPRCFIPFYGHEVGITAPFFGEDRGSAVQVSQLDGPRLDSASGLCDPENCSLSPSIVLHPEPPVFHGHHPLKATHGKVRASACSHSREAR